MKIQLQKLAMVVLTLSIVTACGGDDDNPVVTDPPSDTGDTGDTGDTDNTDVNGDSSGTESETMAAYVGSWTTGCVASQIPGITNTFFNYTFEADTSSWEFVQSGYLDESCTIQMQDTDGGSSERGTTTVAGTYTEVDTITTTDGLPAIRLNLTIDTFTNTLNDSDEEPVDTVGNTFDTLIYVNDADVLFLDDSLLAINESPGTLVLTLPFDRVP